MANWYGAWRTNYVKLKSDRIKDLEHFPITLVRDNDGRYALLSEDDGGEPVDYILVPPADFLKPYIHDEERIELEDCIHEFLEPGEVIVIMCSGAEKLRYITGRARAVHSNGEEVSISLNDIYWLAQEAFPDANITEASY
jgi:hypothetical protein